MSFLKLKVSISNDKFFGELESKCNYYIFQASIKEFGKLLIHYTQQRMFIDAQDNKYPLLHKLIYEAFKDNSLIDEKMILAWNHCKKTGQEILDSENYIDEFHLTAKQALLKCANYDYLRCRENLRKFFQENNVEINGPNRRCQKDNNAPHDWIDDLQREYLNYSTKEFKASVDRLTEKDIIKLYQRYTEPFFHHSDLYLSKKKVEILESNKIMEKIMDDIGKIRDIEEFNIKNIKK